MKKILLTLLTVVCAVSSSWAQTPITIYSESFGNNESGSNQDWTKATAYYSETTKNIVTQSSWKISKKDSKPCTTDGSSGLSNAFSGTKDAYIIFTFGDLTDYTDLNISFNWFNNAAKNNARTIHIYVSSDGGKTWGSDLHGDQTTQAWFTFSHDITAAESANFAIKITNSSTNTSYVDDVLLVGKQNTSGGPVDPVITGTNKIAGVEDIVDVSTMFSSSSSGAMSYSITAAPAGAVENTDYMLDGSDFCATMPGEYTVTANQAAVAETFNSGSQTATLTIKQTYTVTFGAAANGSFTVSDENGVLSSGVKVLDGTVLQLLASADAGFKFASWNVTGASPADNTSRSTTLAVDNNVSINANFEVSTDIVVTYDFNDKSNFPSGFPTSGTTKASAQTFSIGGNDLIINAPDAYYIINSTTENCGLFFGKTKNSSNKPQAGTAYLGFPAKVGYKLVEVSATSTTGIAGGLPLNIYTTSLVAVSTASNTVNGSKTTHVFEITNSEASTEYWLTAGGSSGKNLQFDNIVLTYEKVTSEEIAISSAGYATFVPKCNLDFSESDVTAYAVNPDIANDKVILTAQTQVPAGKAIVVKGTEGTHSIPTIASAEDFTTELEVSATAITATAEDTETYYYLGQEADVVGFRPLNVDGTLAAGKCFFKVAKVGSARFMRIATEGETTGIKAIESAKNNAVVYNLAGQRVAADAKGIVIVNGKKMLNK